MRVLVREFAESFEIIHNESVSLLVEHEFEKLAGVVPVFGKSPCELITRSAAMVEQCFGGITTRLWDDPFEWTLPEYLTDKSSLLNYLSEVENTRNRGIESIKDDEELSKMIAAPVEMKSLFLVLLDAQNKAREYLVLAKNAAAIAKKMDN